ncbi:PepSY domain-containing protein [Pseudomonas aeruginosa]|nr:PepSY domain-containing protein [Pseudomonas aeruginosa]
MQSNEKNGRDFYALAWRWHFYAGLFVAPFMILLALTGIVYLFKPQLDALLYPQLLRVEAGAQMRSADQLLAGVRQAHPQAAVSQYLPPSEAGRSAQFVIGEEGRQWNLFVDPYSGRELGRQDAQLNLQAVARALHGELMVGTVGDRLIELAAGWGIVLVVSGLYLWWPRGRAASALFWPRLHLRGRPLWRELHVLAGFWGSLLLLFMLLSGMTWTGYWGKQFADVWNRFPAAMWNDVPTSDMQAGSLNSASRQQVPWPLENTPLPRSQPPAADAHAEHRGHSAQAGHAMPMDMPMPAGIPLQRVVDIARERGVAAGYGIALPSGMEGVYTISVFPDDPRHDATLHIDQYSGKVLADVRWQDYNAVARSVQMGVVLHEGKLFGLGNQLLMLAVCLAILLSSASGLWIWWKRKPAGRLGVPPLRHELPRWKRGIAIMLALGVAFPLVGASLLLVWALDWLVLSRLPAVRRVLA